MSEDSQSKDIKPGGKFGYLREQYRPKWEEAGAILKKTFKPGIPGFGKARKDFARKFIQNQIEEERDELTELLNRKGFQRRFHEEVEGAKRDNTTLVIGIFDLNDLKKINDTLGHQTGDVYIKSAAEVLKNNTRLVDVVGRWGGDEFGIILTKYDLGEIQDLWKRLNEEFEQYQLQTTEEGKVHKPISISAGFSQVNLQNPKESWEQADRAMYKAKKMSKEKGRNIMQTSENLQK